MNVVDTAKAQVKQIVEKVTDKVVDAASSEARVQAITIGRRNSARRLRTAVPRSSPGQPALAPAHSPAQLCQQHGQRYLPQFFDYVQQGDLDPSILITHDMPLEDGVRAYDMFKKKTDGCIRVALRP